MKLSRDAEAGPRPGPLSRNLPRLPQARPHLLRRADRSSRLLSRGIRRAPALAEGARLCRYRRACAVSARSGVEPNRLRDRADAGRPLGGLAAWAGFTLPSAVLMLLFAYGAGGLAGSSWGAGLLHGLKLVAVAIVAQAVLGHGALSLSGQAARLDRDGRPRPAAVRPRFARPGRRDRFSAAWRGSRSAAAAANRSPTTSPCRCRGASGVACLGAFFALLALSFVSLPGGLLALFAAFYRSGALVFGGGHVVLPLLRDAVVAPGWVSDNAFLAGYGAAQAVPGPLFTFAAYLGAVDRRAAGRRRGRPRRPRRDLSAGHAGADGRVAVLA